MKVVALPIVCQAKRASALLVGALVVLIGSCARTGLDPGELAELGDVATGGERGMLPGGSGGSALKPLPIEDAGSDASTSAGAAAAPPSGEPTGCQPSDEVCNGADDDCDGAVDELLSEPCPEGGLRFCVAGKLSECPRRCEVCVAGSVRVCQNSFCTFWGEQECAADGQGFGYCREQDPPPECADIARQHQDSPQLERCCIDNGYCCVDDHDLDHDGNRREMLGTCDDVACR